MGSGDVLLVLGTCQWDALAWKLTCVSSQSGGGFGYVLQFFTSLDQRTVAKFEPCSPAHMTSLALNLELPGVALRSAAGTNCTLLETALSKGSCRLTLKELKDLASLKQLGIAGECGRKAVIQLLVDEASPNMNKAGEAKNVEDIHYGACQHEALEAELDDQFAEGIDELLCHDRDFTPDVRHLKDRAQVKSIRQKRLDAASVLPKKGRPKGKGRGRHAFFMMGQHGSGKGKVKGSASDSSSGQAEGRGGWG